MGEFEFVAEPPGDAETLWYIEEYGGGVMVKEPKFFGCAFVSDTENDEDLVFVSRSEGT